MASLRQKGLALMLIEFVADLAKLAFFVLGAYAVLRAYAQHHRPDWAARLTRRRLAVLGALTLAMSAIKLVEDVVAKESGPVDTAVLWFVREHVPAALNGFFSVLTQSGAAAALLPATLIVVAALLLARRRFEALLMAVSMVLASGSIYALKFAVGRDRPVLWEGPAYWGSSFPSGHTLATAAFATAAAFCAARLWPRFAAPAALIAMLWAGLVALSRLVLGVHWPSDVLAALCLGVFIPLLLSVLFDSAQTDRRTADKDGA